MPRIRFPLLVAHVLAHGLAVGCSARPLDGDLAPRHRSASPDAVEEPVTGQPMEALPTDPVPGDAPAAEGGPAAASSEAGASRPGCASGVAVYAFRNGDRYRYRTTSTPPDGFAPAGVAMHLARSGATNTRMLYLLRRPEGDDAILTLDASEGAGLGYTQKEDLGSVYAQPVVGSVKLLRHVKASPLRHWSGTSSAEAPPGFEAEPADVGHVCPP